MTPAIRGAVPSAFARIAPCWCTCWHSCWRGSARRAARSICPSQHPQMHQRSRTAIGNNYRQRRRLTSARVILPAHLRECLVLAQRELVPDARIDLIQRRLGQRRALQSKDIRNRGDRFPKIRTGWIVVDQVRRVLLGALVVGARSRHRQSLREPGDGLQLEAPDPVIRPVGREREIAEAALRVEELHDGVLPVLLIHSAVQLQPVRKKLGLESQFVVGERIRAILFGVAY